MALAADAFKSPQTTQKAAVLFIQSFNAEEDNPGMLEGLKMVKRVGNAMMGKLTSKKLRPELASTLMKVNPGIFFKTPLMPTILPTLPAEFMMACLKLISGCGYRFEDTKE